jgi:hypothetical protein
VGRLETSPERRIARGEADTFAKAGESPRVVVLEPGAAPLENLSYEFTPGAKETSVMRMDMAMKMDMGNGNLQAFPIPQIEMRFDLATAAKKEANGDIAVTGTVTEVKVNPGKDATQQRAADEMKKALSGINGMTMSYVVSPKGRSHDAVDVPAGAAAEASTNEALARVDGRSTAGRAGWYWWQMGRLDARVGRRRHSAMDDVHAEGEERRTSSPERSYAGGQREMSGGHPRAHRQRHQVRPGGTGSQMDLSRLAPESSA